MKKLLTILFILCSVTSYSQTTLPGYNAFIDAIYERLPSLKNEEEKAVKRFLRPKYRKYPKMSNTQYKNVPVYIVLATKEAIKQKRGPGGLNKDSLFTYLNPVNLPVEEVYIFNDTIVVDVVQRGLGDYTPSGSNILGNIIVKYDPDLILEVMQLHCYFILKDKQLAIVAHKDKSDTLDWGLDSYINNYEERFVSPFFLGVIDRPIPIVIAY